MVECLGHRRSTTAQRTGVRLRCAGFFPFQGTVNLGDDADVTMSIVLDFDSRRDVVLPSVENGGGGVDGDGLCGLPADRLRSAFIGTCHATRRSLHSELALPRRAYLGPTSLEPMLALAMCNMAAVRPGFLVMDPFVGTGSILVAGKRILYAHP